MADVTVTTLPHGPYLVVGQVTLKDAQGQERTVEGEQIALCRCGASGNKPFCDGAHDKVGFRDGPVA